MGHLGEKLRNYREKSGKKQSEIAENLGISVRTLQSIEETGIVKKTQHQVAINKLIGQNPQLFADSDDDTIKDILRTQARMMEAILKILDRQDRRTERIETNLGTIADRQLTIQAEVQAVQQWDAQSSAAGDKEKEGDYLRHIQQLSTGNRERLKNENIVAGKGM